MSFRETRHFDINFRETRSISTTFSPFPSLRAVLLFPLAHSFLPSPLGGLGRLSRGTKLRASLEKCPTTPHRFLFLLFPGLAASFIHAFFPLPPPPKGPTPSFLESMGPTSIPSSPFSSPFLLSLAVPSARKERQTPDRLYLFSTYRGKVEVDGERKKKKKKERKRKNIRSIEHRVSTFLEKKKERKKERKEKTEFGRGPSEFDEFENHLSSKSISNIAMGWDAINIFLRDTAWIRFDSFDVAREGGDPF